jgi:hypothetical protein
MTIEPCGDCGMPCEPGEYHPFAACLMFKACHRSDVVRANLQFVVDHGKGAHLTPPAQAVDVGAIREVMEGLYSNADDCARAKFPNLGQYLGVCAAKLTAALPKDSNGSEGVGS